LKTAAAPGKPATTNTTPSNNTQNADTDTDFGEPVYTYALKSGINDGYLTPFKVRQIETNLDEYTYTLENETLEGTVNQEKTYTEKDFNRIIEIEEREHAEKSDLYDVLTYIATPAPMRYKLKSETFAQRDS